MNWKNLNKFFIGCCALLLLAGCQTTRETLNFDTNVELTLSATTDVNPDSDGRSSPVVVRVFMLADDRQFSREEFLNLYENAESRLGRDLIDTVILKEFAPGEERVETLGLTPEVKYIGLLAEFVQYQRAESLMLLPIKPHNDNEYAVTLTDIKIVSTDALDRRQRAVTAKKREQDSGKTVTISSAEYERLQKLRQGE
ncbi:MULTISPECIES: type VI secretion system lipoprotein TssJ [Microbulbifer]|nr:MULTISPECIES: type VI secretion system lipoprotein TssJ [Microbulbifer]UFN56778.1 type VI secretion system lipoprotein TssJ [Microbulbifer celer]